MQFKIKIMCGFHKSCERMFWARQATVIWFVLMLVLSVLQAWANDAWDTPRNLHTGGCLQSPPSGAASCSGWSNGTKSVFLRGLVPFNQLQQGWQCPVLGGMEEIRMWLNLHARVSLKKTTLILSYALMLPGRERGRAPGSQVSKIFLLSTQSFVALRPQPQPLTCSWHTQSVKILRMEFLPAVGHPG